MARVTSVEDFLEYSDRALERAEAEADKRGALQAETALKLLDRYQAPGSLIRDVRMGETQRGRDEYMAEWRAGEHTSDVGLGVGVRALVSSLRVEKIREHALTHGLDDEALQIEEDIDMGHRPVIGLVLDQGAYEVDERRAGGVVFYPEARYSGADLVTPAYKPNQFALMSSDVFMVTDAGGSVWTPPGHPLILGTPVEA